jgi:hypothetical protein
MLHRKIILLLCMSGCQIEDLVIYPEGSEPPPAEEPMRLDVLAFLDGKTLVMEPDGVPSHPNGFDANINYGQATQCIHRVVMTESAGNFRLMTEMATLEGAPQTEDVGRCDRATPNGQTFSFDTTAAHVENTKDDGSCFDLTLTYAGFGQEGRGGFSPDKTILYLELFFRDQAIGHRCADGGVGDPTITLNQEAFTGDAVQVYQVGE